MDNTLKKKDIIKFVILITFLSSMFICGIIFAPKIKEYISFENIRTIVGKNKFLSVLIFILMQILQIVIFIIPGDIINATGGFLFNLVYGSILSSISFAYPNACSASTSYPFLRWMSAISKYT